MAKIVRLTESDLTRLVKRVINESKYLKSRDMDRWMDDEKGRYVDDIENFDTDYDEEEFDDYDSFSEKHPGSTRHFNWGGDEAGKGIFDTYKNKYGPLKVRTRRNMDESEESGEERSDEEINKMVDYFWDSMTTGEKKRFMSKIDKERKEKGLPPIRTKSSRIIKKDK
jgi:hypothetical protein